MQIFEKKKFSRRDFGDKENISFLIFKRRMKAMNFNLNRTKY